MTYFLLGYTSNLGFISVKEKYEVLSESKERFAIQRY